MTHSEVVDFISGCFSAQWGSRTPIAWPNDAYEPQEGTPWVRVTILQESSDWEAITGSNTEEMGRVVVQVFVPRDSGTQALNSLVDAARAAFRDADGPDIRFGAPGSRWIEYSEAEQPHWHQANVSVPFEFRGT